MTIEIKRVIRNLHAVRGNYAPESKRGLALLRAEQWVENHPDLPSEVLREIVALIAYKVAANDKVWLYTVMTTGRE